MFLIISDKINISFKVNSRVAGQVPVAGQSPFFLESLKQKHINYCKITCSVGTSKSLIYLFSDLFRLIMNIA